jgi:TRAP-type C4-dicarboxylate transport system substrate-binding protein
VPGSVQGFLKGAADATAGKHQPLDTVDPQVRVFAVPVVEDAGGQQAQSRFYRGEQPCEDLLQRLTVQFWVMNGFTGRGFRS